MCPDPEGCQGPCKFWLLLHARRQLHYVGIALRMLSHFFQANLWGRGFRKFVYLIVAIALPKSSFAESPIDCLLQTNYGFLVAQPTEGALRRYDLSPSWPYLPEVAQACSGTASGLSQADRQIIFALAENESSRQTRLQRQGWVEVGDYLLQQRDFSQSTQLELGRLADAGYSPAVQVLAFSERFGAATPDISDTRRAQIELLGGLTPGEQFVLSFNKFFSSADFDPFGGISDARSAFDAGLVTAHIPFTALTNALLDTAEAQGVDFPDGERMGVMATAITLQSHLYGSTSGAFRTIVLYRDGKIEGAISGGQVSIRREPDPSLDNWQHICPLAQELWDRRIVEAQMFVYQCALFGHHDREIGPLLEDMNAIYERDFFHYLLGFAYAQGELGVAEDPDQARFHWRRSVALGGFGRDELEALQRGEDMSQLGQDAAIAVGSAIIEGIVRSLLSQ